ncbi:MAG: BACON domain-containing protein, partial [Bryobacteraceae bacterium]|nr:BACON domain-containing protein [Bryobacteraceae bacterium]
MRPTLLLLISVPLCAQYSLVTTSTPMAISFPKAGESVQAPYNKITGSRVEARLTNVRTCVTGDQWGSFGRILGASLSDGATNNPFGFGCLAAGQSKYNVNLGNGSRNLGDLGDYPEMFIRIQRDGVGVGRFSVEIWRPDGTGYQNFSYDNPLAGVPITIQSAFQDKFIRGFGAAEFAWLRWYSSTVPEGSSMPKDWGGVPGDLGDWEFEESLIDSSGRGTVLTRSGSCPSSCFVPSLVHPPVLQASIQDAAAGMVMTLDASGSFVYGSDRSQLVIAGYTWQQINGPSAGLMTNPNSEKTQVSRIIEGDYTFRLTMMTTVGGISKDIDVKVRNTDARGFAILPSNGLVGSLIVSFQLESFPGAVDVRATVVKPDGRTLPPTICTSSPCVLPADDRQGSHLVQLEYRDATGAILSSTGWQTVSVTAGPKPGPTTPSLLRPILTLWGLGALPSVQQERIAQFLADKAGDFSGGSASVRKSNPAALQTAYSDHAALYPAELYALRTSAQKHSYLPEDMLLHIASDYQTTNRYIWKGQDQFDASEKTGYGAINGVVLINGSTMIDKTTAAYDLAPADVPIQDKVLIGYADPFDEIHFVLSRAANGCSVSLEYWNGSAWSPLSSRSDSTMLGNQRLGQDGKVLFTPPANWAVSVQVGQNLKWWVRIRVAGGTTPVASRIYGDDWMTAGKARGWNSADPNRLNVGRGSLEYNPNPPAGATARFRHQSRVLGIWGDNLFFLNVSNVQNNERTAARFVVDRTGDLLSKGWNGLLIDNGIPAPNLSSPVGWQSLTEMAGRSITDEAVESYKQIGSYMRSIYPGYALCVNSSYWVIAQHGNCFFDESLKFTHSGPQPYGAFTFYPPTSYRSGGPEQLKPENNPKNVVGWIEISDNSETEFLMGPTWVAWDKTVRGPMVAMASYLMYANANTRFMYHNDFNFIYYGLDDFQYHLATPDWITTSDVMADTSASTKYVSGNFVSVPSSLVLMVRMGPSGEYVTWRKASNTQLYTTEAIGANYSSGTYMFRVLTGRLSTDDLPPLERVRSWGQYFPAMSINIGEPDPAGHNGGRPSLAWKSAVNSGTLNGIQRRDFKGAIVLYADAVNVGSGVRVAYLNTYGKEVIFAAEGMPGKLYPLLPNGRTGEGVASIRLRTGEGVILMKEPVDSSASVPANASGAIPICDFSAGLSSQVIGVLGGSITGSMTTGAGCAWTGQSNSGWLTLSTGSAQGSRAFTVFAAPNTGATRSAGIVIAGQAFTITQAACAFVISLSTHDAGAASAVIPASITTGPACAWTAQSKASWLVLSAGSGQGSGTPSISVSANASGARTAAVSIAGQTFNIGQAAYDGRITSTVSLDSLSPFAGIATDQTFTMVYGDTAGWNDLASTYLVINSSLETAASCYIQYNPATAQARLYDDS